MGVLVAGVRPACCVMCCADHAVEAWLQVASMAVQLSLGVPAPALAHLDRVLATFEDFCTVTGSVKAAFPVTVTVFDSLGERLK